MNKKQLNDIVSLSLMALKLGVNGNYNNFILEFTHTLNNRELAESLYYHLLAIETGSKLSQL